MEQRIENEIVDAVVNSLRPDLCSGANITKFVIAEVEKRFKLEEIKPKYLNGCNGMVVQKYNTRAASVCIEIGFHPSYITPNNMAEQYAVLKISGDSYSTIKYWPLGRDISLESMEVELANMLGITIKKGREYTDWHSTVNQLFITYKSRG